MSGTGAVISLMRKCPQCLGDCRVVYNHYDLCFGVYFPLEFLPESFRSASLILPATYVARGFRFVMGVEVMPHACVSFIWETLVLCAFSLAAIWIVAVKGSGMPISQGIFTSALTFELRVVY